MVGVPGVPAKFFGGRSHAGGWTIGYDMVAGHRGTVLPVVAAGGAVLFASAIATHCDDHDCLDGATDVLPGVASFPDLFERVLPAGGIDGGSAVSASGAERKFRAIAVFKNGLVAFRRYLVRGLRQRTF